LTLAVLAVFISTVVAKGDDAAVEPVAIEGRAQGTTYHIKYWGKGAASREEVQAAVEELLKRFDREMSTYRDDSEVSRFNRSGGGEWFAVSPETAHIVEQSIHYGRLTDGILDITVAPVLRLWHFGPGGLKEQGLLKPPSEEQLNAAKMLVGLDHVRVRREPPALWKDAAGIEIELSSIAPGYAVDLLVERIKAFGFANVMVELGGEVRAVGVRPDGSPWRVGIERARPDEPGMLRVLPLKEMSTSTAGDYKNIRTEDGRRVTHIIDPRIGQALPYRGAAVTVVAETALESDALDTPLLIMGSSAGYEWCVKHKVAALFQERGTKRTSEGKGGELVVRTTPRFEAILKGVKGAEAGAGTSNHK
jgi:thiamine biosynthesis lipoprotein